MLVRIKDGSSQRQCPAGPRPVACRDGCVLQVIASTLGSLDLGGGNEESRSKFAFRIRENTGLGLNVERDVVGFEVFLASHEANVVARGELFCCLVVSDDAGLDTHVLICSENIAGIAENVLVPLLLVGCNLNLALF